MKTYNGEKAIISLTSWKARINTVAKTLYSLIEKCPGFHIVLVLSEEEFPKKEEELPENLRLFIDNDLIEVLWVYKNYKSFKKVLFTMDKYRDVPVISADDGCIYTKNYAEELYKKWCENKNKIISEYNAGICGFVWGGSGHGMIFPPNCFSDKGIKSLTERILSTNHDDAFYGVLAKNLHINFCFINRRFCDPHTFHDIDKSGLTNSGKFKDSACRIINAEILKCLK